MTMAHLKLCGAAGVLLLLLAGCAELEESAPEPDGASDLTVETDAPTESDTPAATEADVEAETDAGSGTTLAAPLIPPASAPEQALLDLSPLDFYATQSVALRIARECEGLNFDLRRNADLVAARGDPEGAFGIVVRRGSVRARSAELLAALVDKHGAVLGDGDLCALGAAERTEGTAVSGTLRGS